MKSLEILKRLSTNKYANYELVATSNLREFEIYCGELKQNKWYIFCEHPQLGKADACGRYRSDSKQFYAYIVHE